MREPVRKLFKEAMANDEFQEQLKEADPDYRGINIFTDELVKITVASIYQGWLIAKGEFINSKYY